MGTLDAYYEASMDLVKVVPEFDLFNPEWPLRTANLFSPRPSSSTRPGSGWGAP